MTDCTVKDVEKLQAKSPTESVFGVELVPQEYEWLCPECGIRNFIINEKYPRFVQCFDCENVYRAFLKKGLEYE